MNFFVSAFIYFVCATTVIYFLFAFYALYVISYNLSEEGIEVSIFSINLNFIRYDELISVCLNSMQLSDIEIDSVSHQRSVSTLGIRLVTNRVADPILSGFGSPKKVRLYIYPRNTIGFYNELLSRFSKVKNG